MAINLDNLDEETKKKVLNLQNLSTSLEYLTQQKFQLETTLRETESAIEILEKTSDDTPVYKSIGGIMVKSEKKKLFDEKKSLKITLEMRLKTIEQKKSRIEGEVTRMRTSLQADLQNRVS
jgi:prefoldin beta subunit